MPNYRIRPTVSWLAPNQQFRRHKIVRAWLVCALLILAIGAAATAQLWYSYQQAIASATERANAKSFLIAEWVAKSFALKQYVLSETVSQFDAEDLQYPSLDPQRHQQQTQALVARAQTLPNMLFLGMLNTDCIVTHTSIGINLGFDASSNGREYCQLALSEPQNAFKVSNMFVSVDNSLNVTISLPMFNDEQGLQGVALAGLDLTFFQRWLDLIELEQDDNVITLYDLNSRVLARKPLLVEQLGRQVVEARLNDMANAPLSQLQSPYVHRLVSPVDGVDRVWSLRRMGDLPFIVVIGEQTHNSLGSWRQQLSWYLLAFALLVASLLVSTLSYVRNLFQTERLSLQAISDPLTGLANRRFFADQFAESLARLVPEGAAFSLIMADLDYFKQINDGHGHDMGDQVLCQVAERLQSLCRQGDVLARWGGEEFVLLLPYTDTEPATGIAERCRQGICQLDGPGEQRLTMSFGVVSYQSGDSLDSLISRADAALYRAKHTGRNRVVVS